jgi:lipopolysaccharide transport system ATP-binding protein
MKQEVVLKVEAVAKQYRLGLIGTGTISHDLNRWWHKIRGKNDPYLKIGEQNDRSKKGSSAYVWALKDISFEVNRGEVLGIIGKNGAGKSTLLKVLSKVTGPSTGRILANGRIASLLEVGTGFHPELTGKENIFLNGAILGMTKAEIADAIDEIISFSGCERYIDTPVKRYSSGMKVRLAFAVAAHLEPEILIVDEVLAVGDAEFQKKAIGKMKDIAKDGGRTVLFVSHDMAAINSLCSRLLVLEAGKVSYDGAVGDGIGFYLSDTEHRKDLMIGNNIIKSIAIANSTTFVSGNDLKISLDFKINTPTVNPVMLININNNAGTKIAEFHTTGVGFSENLESDCVLDLEIKKFNAHIGNYSIDIVFYDGKKYELRNVASFSCVEVDERINNYHKRENNFFFNYNYTIR